MSLRYEDPWLTVHVGDCRDVLATLPEASVHCVVTSPPYWGLRDYGTASWDGGDPSCDHQVGTFDAKRGDRERYSGHDKRPGRECGKCGAVRQDRQLGLEETPEAYVANMVAVFREVRRVLRDDGTLWLNLGDSYASHPAGNTDATFSAKQASNRGNSARRERSTIVPGLKPKDLVGIPWRVAFALQADGWYLRSDIIWAKPNPMPESVTDRPTKAHEYLFLLTKSGRYWYDADAVREPAETAEHHERYHEASKTYRQWTPPGQSKQGNAAMMGVNPAGRNRRSVWTVATQPYPGAHFAVMPEALVEPCILAGCPEGGTVLDPFGGSGTVAVVAQRHRRRAVLIELNPEYADQSVVRASRSWGKGGRVRRGPKPPPDGSWVVEAAS